jgi:hypothetical protein
MWHHKIHNPTLTKNGKDREPYNIAVRIIPKNITMFSINYIKYINNKELDYVHLEIASTKMLNSYFT